jgi:hypothetical protein
MIQAILKATKMKVECECLTSIPVALWSEKTAPVASRSELITMVVPLRRRRFDP